MQRVYRSASRAAAIGALIVATAFGPIRLAGAGQAMTFEAGCASDHGKKVLVAAVGDLLFHKRLQLQAYSRGSDFKRFFQPMAAFLSAADILYGNLEGPAAHGTALGGRNARDPGRVLDGRVYAAHLKTLNFNYHPSVIDDLIAVGFDVVSTANNHTMDRGPLGVDRTIENLVAKGLPFTGTRTRGDTMRPWSTITRKNGVSVAWLSCTYSTNGLPDPDGQVLGCYTRKDVVLAEIAFLRDKPDVDAVILVPHWGVENSHRPWPRQQELGRQAIDAGATAVIGTHAHVVQPWEKHVTPDGREGLIVYGTGNFISNQRKLMQRAGALIVLEIAKQADGKAKLAAAGFVPTWVVIDNRGHRVTVNRGGGWPAQALRQMLTIYPAGNRIGAVWPPDLPKRCDQAASVEGPAAVAGPDRR